MSTREDQALELSIELEAAARVGDRRELAEVVARRFFGDQQSADRQQFCIHLSEVIALIEDSFQPAI